MAGISIDVTLRDDGQLRLQELLDRMSDRRPFYAAVGERLVGSAGENFRREADPDGTPWLSLRPSTIRARQRLGQLPLTILRSNSKGRSGSSLAGSINFDATTEGVKVGSPKEYAAIHQLGGTIQKPERAAKIYRVKAADGTVGRQFVKKSAANHVTDVTIPAHGIKIPARPYLGISIADEEGIFEDAALWLTLEKS